MVARPEAPTVGRGRWLPLILFLLALTALRALDPAPVAQLRELAFDLFQKLHPRAGSSARTVIVDIDEASLAAHGQWPWPRAQVARLVDAVAAREPRVIGLEILFPEADRLTPAQVAQLWPGLSPSTRSEILRQPSGDAVLAASFARAPVVLGVAVGQRQSLAGGKAAPANGALTGAPDRPVGGMLLGASLPRFAAVLDNLPELARAASGTGAVAVSEDSGRVRKIPVAVRVGARVIPGFAAEMARVGAGGAPLPVAVSPWGLEAVQVGPAAIATDRVGQVRIAWATARDRTRLSARSVLAGALAPDALRGRHVLIAAGASGLAGLHPTPLGEQVDGAELHAQGLDTMLGGAAPHRHWSASAIEIGATLLLTALGLVMVCRARLRVVGLYFLFLAVGTPLLCWQMFLRQSLLFDPVFPVGAFLGAGVFIVAGGLLRARYAAERRVQERESRLLEVQVELQRLSGFAAVEQVSRALAHELNQPLYAISNFVQASRKLLTGSVAAGREKADGYLARAIAEVDRAAGIIAGLRALVQRGEVAFSHEDLNDIVSEAVDAALIGAPADTVALRFDLAGGLSPVHVNRIQIQQILVNLVRNACEAMAGQPRRGLVVRTAPAGEGRVAVEVEDEGPPLAADALAALFKPFTTTKDKGMGLGLSISRSIARAHGGTLDARPRGGGGLVFTLLLPVAGAGGDAAADPD